MRSVTEAGAISGRKVTVLRHIALADGSIGLVTVHPSYLLCFPEEVSETREYTKYATDIRMAISALAR